MVRWWVKTEPDTGSPPQRAEALRRSLDAAAEAM